MKVIDTTHIYYFILLIGRKENTQISLMSTFHEGVIRHFLSYAYSQVGSDKWGFVGINADFVLGS